VPGALRSFWIVDTATGERRQITARLRTQTPHIAMWVEEDTWHDVRKLQGAAEHVEADIYTRLRAAFGSEWTPGIDMDPHVHILHTTSLSQDVVGYTSSIDEYPSDVFPSSNEAEMITVNIEAVEVGSPGYNALLARELLRLIQRHQDRNETRWVREGLAELAAALCGSSTDSLNQAYLRQTDTSLTAWTDDDSHRGASYLFLAYFHQRFGDEGTRALTGESANGVRGFEAALDKLGAELTFDRLFADWLTANYLDSTGETNKARYTYSGLDLAQPTTSAVYDTYPVRREASVHQFGANYILLQGEKDLSVQFKGRTQSPLLSRMPNIEDQSWWSNRADQSLTTLTGRFDLRKVDRATLTYRVWYDIESHYDYATVEISADDGRQWHVLPTPSGTGANPYGNNPGWGYTGESVGWIQEEIDISDHIGREILVRFSYLTDGAITGEGLLLDDISIRDIDRGRERETRESRWSTQGFVLTDGLVRQDYAALLISKGEDLTVERLLLEEDQSAEWIVPLGTGDVQEAVLVISAVTPQTHQPASYQLSISAQSAQDSS
jgi:hypothetical protein